MHLFNRPARRLGAVGAALAALLAAVANPAGASTPALLVLAHRGQGQTVSWTVADQPGASPSPDAVTARAHWTIAPGTTLESSHPPADRQVTLFQGVPPRQRLLCVIEIRYFANASGAWVPRYQLQQQALIVPRNGRWTPITLFAGGAPIVLLSGSGLANAEGYYVGLRFGLTAGPVSISSWVVR